MSKTAEYSESPPYFLPLEEDWESCRVKANQFFQRLQKSYQAEEQKLSELHELTSSLVSEPSLIGLCGIGPVRAYYYRGLLDHGLETPKKSRFYSQGEMVTPARWLFFDWHYGTLLAQLGLSWNTLETAVFEAFRNTLPEPFLENHSTAAPDDLLALWQSTWTHWNDLKGRGRANLKKMRTLIYVLLPHVAALPHVFDHSTFSNLSSVSAQLGSIGWILDQGLPKGFRNYASPDKSPFINPLLKAVGDVLMMAADTAVYPQHPALDKIITHLPENRDVEERWQLTADLLNHLPILLGLPDDKLARATQCELRETVPTRRRAPHPYPLDTDAVSGMQWWNIPPGFHLTSDAIKHRVYRQM